MHKLAQRFSNFNRERKFKYFLECFRPSARDSILDIGASENEYQESGNILEKRYPYPEKITVLGVDEYKEFTKRYPKVRAVRYAGAGRFPFKDQEFDLCWSNAVLEHVGDRFSQVAFLKEVRRVSKHGFITTPNRFFPVELHTRTLFLHYLPKEHFDRILAKLGQVWAAGPYMHLLSLSQLRSILKEAGIYTYKIKKNRFMGFVVDFVVIF